MPRPTKPDEPQKQGPPVAFRPGPDLEQMVRLYADEHKFGLPTAYKNLAALAVVGLDRRHTLLLMQLAASLVGDNTFSRACVYIHAALVAAGQLRGGIVPHEEPLRSRLVFGVVQQLLLERGVEINDKVSWVDVVDMGSECPVAPPTKPQPAPTSALSGKPIRHVANIRVHEERAAKQSQDETE